MRQSNTSERLKQIMRERGLKQVDILSAVNPYCKKLNLKMNRSDISQYVNGKVEPNQPKLTALSMALNVSETWLMGYDTPSMPVDIKQYPNLHPVQRCRIPMLGAIAAGKPIFAEQDYETFVDIDDSVKADLALAVEGDSMDPLYKNGDIVFIRSQPDVRDGQVAAVIVDDSATLKRVYHLPIGVQLVPVNPEYEPMLFTADNSDNIVILGLAVGYFRKTV